MPTRHARRRTELITACIAMSCTHSQANCATTDTSGLRSGWQAREKAQPPNFPEAVHGAGREPRDGRAEGVCCLLRPRAVPVFQKNEEFCLFALGRAADHPETCLADLRLHLITNLTSQTCRAYAQAVHMQRKHNRDL